MAQRIPRDESLSRVHGVGALFAAAYGNVGSSIYYALGVTAAFALGLTPIAFVISGLIFAATAATYAEATVMYPGGGGLLQLRPPRLQRAGQLRRRLGADAQLRDHGRDLGLLRAPLPGRLLGAAGGGPGRHHRRRRGDRRPRGAQHPRLAGVGKAQPGPGGRRPRHPGRPGRDRHRPGAQPRGPGRQRPPRRRARPGATSPSGSRSG